jgi:hypothetical protein
MPYDGDERDIWGEPPYSGEPIHGVIRLIIGVFVVVATIIIAVYFISPAGAHDHYSALHDPVTGGRCCGGHDCAVLKIEPGVLTPIADGYEINLTREQAQKINPYRSTPAHIIVPEGRIQKSFDGNFHLCIPNESYVHANEGPSFYCFLAPNSM